MVLKYLSTYLLINKKTFLFFFILISFLYINTSSSFGKEKDNIINISFNSGKKNKENFSEKFHNKEIPNWLARLELARVLSYAKKYDESIKEYDKVLLEKPDFYDARLEMIQVLYWQGKTDQAIKELNKIPENKITKDIQLIIADISIKQKKYSKAEKIYKKYLKLNPNDSKIRLKLAEILSWQKKYKKSLFEYKILVKKYPKDIQLRRKYALVLKWSGKFKQSAEQLKKTLK